MFKAELNVTPVLDVLTRLIQGATHTSPVLAAVGERVIEHAKQSFDRSASPDGTPWAANAKSTMLHYLEQVGGVYKKNGDLSKKGQTRLASKKPLIGATRDLSRQFSYHVDADSVTVSNSMVYAAMQQYGGTKAKFPHLWGDIPARPFFPVDASGELMPLVRDELMEIMQDYLDTLTK